MMPLKKILNNAWHHNTRLNFYHLCLILTPVNFRWRTPTFKVFPGLCFFTSPCSGGRTYEHKLVVVDSNFPWTEQPYFLHKAVITELCATLKIHMHEILQFVFHIFLVSFNNRQGRGPEFQNVYRLNVKFSQIIGFLCISHYRQKRRVKRCFFREKLCFSLRIRRKRLIPLL